MSSSLFRNGRKLRYAASVTADAGKKLIFFGETLYFLNSYFYPHISLNYYFVLEFLFYCQSDGWTYQIWDHQPESVSCSSSAPFPAAQICTLPLYLKRSLCRRRFLAASSIGYACDTSPFTTILSRALGWLKKFLQWCAGKMVDPDVALPQIALLGAGIFVRTQYIPRLKEIADRVIVKSIWSRSEVCVLIYLQSLFFYC